MSTFTKKALCLFSLLIGLSSITPVFSMVPGFGGFGGPWFSSPAAMEYYFKMDSAKRVIKHGPSLALLEKLLKSGKPELCSEPSIKAELEKIFKRFNFLQRLLLIQDRITDEPTQALVKKWIEDEVLLDEPEEQVLVTKVFHRIQIADDLKEAVMKYVTDQETKDLIWSWLDNPVVLDDDIEVRVKVNAIMMRLELLYRLEAGKDGVKDDATLELITTWIENPRLLDEKEAQAKANAVVDRIQLYALFKKAYEEGLIKEKEHVRLVEKWIEDPIMFDDPEVKLKAKEVHEWLYRGPLLKKLQLTQRVKDGGVIGYTLYKKFMFLRALESGKMRGWIQQLIDVLSSFAYLGCDGYALYLNMCKQLTPAEQNAPWLQRLLALAPQIQKLAEPGGGLESRISSWKDTVSFMLKDDLKDYVGKTLYSKGTKNYLKDKFTKDDRGQALNGASLINSLNTLVASVLNRIITPDYLRHGTASLEREPLDALEYERFKGDWPQRKQMMPRGKAQTIDAFMKAQAQGMDKELQLGALEKFLGSRDDVVSHCRHQELEKLTAEDIRTKGCRGKELEWASVFDSYLDRLIQKKVSEIIKVCNIPKSLKYGLRGLWENRLASFVRKTLLFKVSPTLIYWTLWSDPENSTSGRLDDYRPCKEMVKSISGALKMELTSGVVSMLNRGMDAKGRGLLDAVHDKTFGLVGPNAISFIVNMGVTYPFLKVTNKLHKDVWCRYIEKDQNPSSFLTANDFFINYPDPEHLRMRNGRSPATQDEIDQRDNFQHKRVGAWFIQEVFTNTGKWVSSYFLLKFFKKTRPGITDWATGKCSNFMDFLVRRNMIDTLTRNILGWLGETVSLRILPFVGHLFLTKPAGLSEWDKAESFRDFNASRDDMVFVDHLLAGAIGNAVCSRVSRWAVGKLADGIMKGVLARPNALAVPGA